MAGLVLTLSMWVFSSHRLYGLAQVEGFMVTNENAGVFRKLPDIENQLYGHSYASQSVGQRINRIEKTLFGFSQRGPVEVRMQGVLQQMSAKSSQAQSAEQRPMLGYLEEKLFQRTFPEKSNVERLRQLETQVFGHSFDNYPEAIRLKKLTYAMPIMAKEIRLTKGDSVIASTGRLSQKGYRAPRADVEMVQLEAVGSTVRSFPNSSAPLSAVDYVQSVYRNADGTLLRWNALPIKVYNRLEGVENNVSTQALQQWQARFSAQSVPMSSQADVIVTWDPATWAQNSQGVLTRPVVQVDEHHAIRTVILISMYPLRGQPEAVQLHVLAHQLGHAFGLWGHSNDPGDIMYPALRQEINDFPSKWAWRSSSITAKAQATVTNVLEEPVSPSQRDFNTLMRVYDLPLSDLSAYSPY